MPDPVATPVKAPRWRRVVEDDGQDGEGGPDVSANNRGLVVDSLSFLGAFQWYGFLPYSPYLFPPTDDPWIPLRFLDMRFDGDSDMYFFGVNASSGAATGIEGTIQGTPDPGFTPRGGMLSIDATTGIQTGLLSMESIIGFSGTLTRICAGLSYAYYDQSVTYYTTSTTDVFDLIEDNYTYLPITRLEGLRKTFLSKGVQLPGSFLDPYLVSYCGAGITSAGFLEEFLENQMTLLQAAANGGAASIPPSFRSAITAYNAGTGAMTGEASVLRLRTTTPSQAGTINVTLNFFKTPIGGGVSELVYFDYTADVGVGNFLDVYVQVPNLVGFEVVYFGATVLDLAQIADDFSQLSPGDLFLGTYGVWTGTPLWPDLPFFDLDTSDPSWISANDWSDAQVTQVYLGDYAGFYWPDGGRFSAADPVECSDDFESYPFPDTPSVLGGGLGWVSPGFLLIADFIYFQDDMDGIVNPGVIPLPSYPTVDALLIAISIAWWPPPFESTNFGPQLSPDNYTIFVVADNDTASDGFETYATGAIVSLNQGSGSWSGPGVFA